jgi:hypothetical protein
MTRLNMLGHRVPPAAARLPRRPKVADQFYLSPEWRALVRGLVAVRGRRCEDPLCDAPNVSADQKLYGDHIHELKDGGAPLDAGNVMLRCAPCHGRKTAQAARERMARRW